jgi:O-antigen ligase
MADPFNTPKLIFLAITSSWFLGHLIDSYRSNRFALRSVDGFTLLFALAFIIAMFVSAIFTKPLLIALIGDTQRRNGLLFYLSSVIIFLYIVRKTTFESAILVVKVIILTASILSIYGLIQISGNDFINWVNPYNTMLSTLGNPNFASALLAVFAVFLFLGLFLKSLPKFYKYNSLVVLVFSFICIVLSDSRQGLLVFIFALLFFIVFFVMNQKNHFKIMILPTAIFIFALSIIGMLQKGPFASLLYKDSVSVRGYYWRAGLEMFRANIFTGVGLDRYEPYFKLYREPGYSLKYGYEIGSSNAHNVVIQLFATGGIFVGITYLSLLGFVLVQGIRLVRGTRGENQLIAMIFLSAWLGFQSQTLISIDNIGISVWGWLISGIILGLTRTQIKNSKLSSTEKPPAQNFRIVKVNLLQPTISILATAPILILSLFLIRAETDLYTLKSIESAPSEENKPYGFIYASKILSNPLADSNSRFEASIILIKLGYIQEGNNAFNSLFDSDPNNLLYLNIVANNEEKNKNIKSAMEFRKKIALLDPWNVDNKVKLSKLYLQMGDLINAKTIKDNLVTFASDKSEVKELIDLVAKT